MKKPVRTLKRGKLEVRVYATREDMGEAAYESYKRQVSAILSQQDSARAVFAAAHSQDDFLACLSRDNCIDFSKITAFHMDEYIGLKEEAPQKFGQFLKKAIFSKRHFGKVNYIQSGGDPQEECKRYEALLREKPLDIVSLGIGENGHIAFNDPAEARFDEKCWVKTVHLDDVCRLQQVHDGEFAAVIDVPKTALTMTVPALMSCKSVVCIVPTRLKARAVRDMLDGPISEECPASALRLHDNAVLFLDDDAASLI